MLTDEVGTARAGKARQSDFAGFIAADHSHHAERRNIQHHIRAAARLPPGESWTARQATVGPSYCPSCERTISVTSCSQHAHSNVRWSKPGLLGEIRASDMRVPHLAQSGRGMILLGGLATIVAIIPSRRKTSGSRLSPSAKLIEHQHAAI